MQPFEEIGKALKAYIKSTKQYETGLITREQMDTVEKKYIAIVDMYKWRSG